MSLPPFAGASGASDVDAQRDGYLDLALAGHSRCADHTAILREVKGWKVDAVQTPDFTVDTGRHLHGDRSIGRQHPPLRQDVEIVEVEPLRLIHEHSDSWSMDNYFRFEPDGDATRVVMESDYEMPGKLPGFIKDLVSKGWVERNTRNILADFKAMAEARGPAHA